MESFYRQCSFGKRKRIIDEGDTGTLISGRRVRQLQDYSFVWDMDDYASKHMKAIEAPRGLLSSTEDLSDDMMSQVETCNGQIGWLGGNGRPDVAAGHSIIASKVKERKPELIKLCNVCVKQAQSHSIKLKVWPIKPKDLRIVVFADSAFDPQGIRH